MYIRNMLASLVLALAFISRTTVGQDGEKSAALSIEPTAASSTAPSVAPSNGSAASTTAVASTAEESSHPSNEPDSSAAQSTTFLTTTSASPSATPDVTSTLPSNATITNTPLNTTAPEPTDPPLPLSPEMSPAFIVAGVILITSGIVYTLLGVKKLEIQVFFSAAYLVAISITVLLVYVMNPPISAGIQGAYVAAAVLPAVILGGGSVIFKDLTEGFATILGGFSVSMFILTLKEGGSITGRPGKIILVGCFCVVAFALSFSRWTRHYAIIGSTSFGGATATVLGIDCFSKAGLKEFWVYLWELNDRIFSSETDTYPLTRGIKVEIAAIIILTLFGVLSQLRIWKIIQERRERKEAALRKAERKRDEEEEIRGRSLEASTGADRQRWEVAYGYEAKRSGGSGSNTVVSSTRQGSESGDTDKGPSVSEFELEELRKLGSLSPTSQKPAWDRSFAVAPTGTTPVKNVETNQRTPTALPTVTVRVAEDDDVETPPGEAKVIFEGTGTSSPSEEKDLGDKGVLSSEIGRAISTAATQPGPVIPPLPFTVPTFQEADEDAQSVATFASSKADRSRPVSQHLTEILRRASLKVKRLSAMSNTSVEAIIDEEGDASDLLGPASAKHSRSTSADSKEKRNSRFSFEEGQDDQGSLTRSADGGSRRLSKADLEEAEGATRSDAAKQTTLAKETVSETPLAAEEDVKSVSSESTKQPRGKTTPIALKRDNLPQAAPKVASQWRTNEWAKYLETAEKPEADDIKVASPEPAVQAVEEPAPVNTAELQQTPLNAAPAPEALSPQLVRAVQSRPSSSRSSNPHTPYQAPSMESLNQQMSRNGSRSSIDTYNNLSSQRRTSKNKPFRSSSTPLIASPIDEDAEASFPPPPARPSLMAQRQTILQNPARNISNSPSPNNSTASLITYRGVSTIPSPRSSMQSFQAAAAADDSDNISLRARKAILQQQQPQPQQSVQLSPAGSVSASLRTASSGALPPSASTANPYIPANPYQSTPPADPAVRRASQLAAWRTSLSNQNQAASIPLAEAEMRRREMVDQKRRSELLREAREREGLAKRVEMERQRSGVIGNGDWEERHREAMRRMQRRASASLGQ